MATEQSVVVNPPAQDSATQSAQTTETRDQMLIQFGELKQQYQQTQTELVSTRLELQEARQSGEMSKSELANLQSTVNQLENKLATLLQAVEEEEELGTQAETSLNGVTVITPPVAETPAQAETPPKKKQSRLNLFLFGKEEEET